MNIRPPDLDRGFLFIELPLWVKVGFGKTVQPYFLAGPSFGFLVASTAVVDFEGYSLEADVKSALRTLMIGVGAGVGIEFPACIGTFFVQGTYTYDLLNLNQGGPINWTLDDMVVMEDELDPEEIIKTRGIQVMAGFRVPLGQ